MVNLDLWIERIKNANIPGLRKIGGSADLGAVEADTRDCPAVWVVPGNESAGSDRGVLQKPSQPCDVEVVIVYAIRNARDTLGMTGHAELETYRYAIRELLYGWIPSDADGPVLYVRGGLMDLNAYTLWWSETYKVNKELYL